MKGFLKTVLLCLWLSLLSFGRTGPLAAEGKKVEKPDEDVRQVAKFVLETVGKLKGNRIAILPFVYLDGSFSVEGRLVSDLLFMELAKQSGKVELLERERLANILEEHKLNEKGMLDPATAPEIGKIIGVNAYVFGRIVDLGHKLQLTLRVVDTQSKVIAQQNFSMNKRIKTPSTPLWEDIDCTTPSNSSPLTWFCVTSSLTAAKPRRTSSILGRPATLPNSLTCASANSVRSTFLSTITHTVRMRHSTRPWFRAVSRKYGSRPPKVSIGTSLSMPAPAPC